MTFPGLRRILKSQRGVALLELLVSLAITGIISTGTVTAVSFIYQQNTRHAAHLSAVTQVENTVSWLNKDVQMAQTVSPSGASGFPLSLTWVDWSGSTHQVTYQVTSGNLVRHHNDGGTPAQTAIAGDISGDDQLTNCQYAGGVFNYEITAVVTLPQISITETRLGKITPRPAM